ncbi:hypothetical protein NC653_021184 [Populus alba x Populus x berolinensis]|uniref:Uncharacterized protein n=1 Tax=Populus alba x Populus x berolinensis TaxID=444605 RepID=A0AAD6QEI1_9ROSI|nr:hypothetical protein NC653_021184 [Populus alba x Populus x berolinensis]
MRHTFQFLFNFYPVFTQLLFVFWAFNFQLLDGEELRSTLLNKTRD